MSEVLERDNNPSVTKAAFACPFCGAYTTQYWFSVRATSTKDNSCPVIWNSKSFAEDWLKQRSPEEQSFILERIRKFSTGKVFYAEEATSSYSYVASNINFSKCYACEDISVWIHEKLVFPSEKTGPEPNIDLPENIKVDYEEARSILDLSPRGSAALLRLCIQKLCSHLTGENDLNPAIGKLQKKGLRKKVINALDIVRVIGNEAVHPGTIDLNDDREAAESLFGLVNIIAEEMISEEKHINNLYSKLPESKRRQIEKRDEAISSKTQLE